MRTEGAGYSSRLKIRWSYENSMQFKILTLQGPLEIANKKLGDARGYFAETFREDEFEREAGAFRFMQENQSLSARVGTVRGIHFQKHPFAQGKLVRCVAGAIFDVAVDLRHDSPRFGEWVSAELSADNGAQLWVPPGFGHGFCTLAPDTVVCYKTTAYYSAECDAGVAWDDADIGVKWPAAANPETLSAKDRQQPSLRELPPLFSLDDPIREPRHAQ